jgi:VWFA-related protein
MRQKNGHTLARVCMEPWRLVAAAGIGVLLILGVSAAGQNGNAPQSSGPSGATNSAPAVHDDAIVVDVVVTQHGHAVQGLARENFHIFEEGREQAITLFEEHHASPAEPQAPPALPPHVYSNSPEFPAISAANVLLLDAMNTPLENQSYVREQMIEYLRSVPVHSYMAIFVLGSRLRLVEGFMSRPEILLAALQGAVESPASSPLAPGGNVVTTQTVAAQTAEHRSALAAVRQFQLETTAFQQIEQRLQITLDAMNALADYLAAIPGRKNLLWLSGSFPVNFEPDLSRNGRGSLQTLYQTQIKQTSERFAAARVAVYPIDVRGLIMARKFGGATRDSSNLGPRPYGGVPSGGRLRGGNQSIQSSETSANGPSAGAFAGDDARFMQDSSSERATMHEIAEETGGLSFYESNSVKDAMARAVENGANYYTLTYVPEDKNFDGRFRKIRIDLPQKDYQLIYRRGYFSDAKPASTSVPLLTSTANAIQRGAPPSSQILFQVTVLPSDDPKLAGVKTQPGPAGLMADKLKGPVKRYSLDFVADTRQVALALGNDGVRHGSLEFLTVAYDHDGGLLNVVRRTFAVNLPPAQFDKFVQTGLPVHEEIDLPPGDVYLRCAVHDLSTDRIGTSEIPIQVIAP